MNGLNNAKYIKTIVYNYIIVITKNVNFHSSFSAGFWLVSFKRYSAFIGRIHQIRKVGSRESFTVNINLEVLSLMGNYGRNISYRSMLP